MMKMVFLPVLLILSSAACTTTHQFTFTSPEDLVTSIDASDVVQLQRQDNTSLEFTVTKVSAEGIYGSNIFVPYAEIRSVSVVRESRLRTGLLIASVVAVLYVLEKHADCGLIILDDSCAE
jgi:hypothetical protein